MAKVEIEVKDDLLDKLSEGFFWQEFTTRQRSNPSGEDILTSALMVARVKGLSVKIWADEHPPPHFHVSYQGRDASFSITDCARLCGNDLNHFEKTIHSWWSENRELLIEKWNKTRPTNCSVGPIDILRQSKSKG